jgi:uncharacterized membrane protein
MRKNFTDVDLNRSVGNLLRLGVILSVATSLIGFIKLFTEGFKMPKKYTSLDMGESSEKVGTLLEFALQRRRNGDYPVGNSSLVFTPLMRIIFALIGYLKEKDYIYVVISSIVLAIMAISFFTGYAH